MNPLIEVPKKEWVILGENIPLKVWKNDQFLVQLRQDGNFKRFSINRTEIETLGINPLWKDGISWDDLQWIKDSIGYKDHWAVEIYPPFDEIVNVANMRHLWLLPEPPIYGWHKK